MSDFKNCESLGSRFEKEVFIMYLPSKNFLYGYKVNGKFSNYDIDLTFKKSSRTIEVKAQTNYDYKPYYTLKEDNIQIEYQQGPHPSGIQLTKADYWYIFKYNINDQPTLKAVCQNKKEANAINGIKYVCYMVKTEKIKEIIQNNLDKLKWHPYNDAYPNDPRNKTYMIELSYFKDVDKYEGELLASDYKELIQYHKVPQSFTDNLEYPGQKRTYYTKEVVDIEDLEPHEINLGYGNSDSSGSSSESEEERNKLRKFFGKLKNNINLQKK